MPKGPQGQRRPADGRGSAGQIAQIATGEKVRQENTTSEDHKAIAQKAAVAWWS